MTSSHHVDRWSSMLAEPPRRTTVADTGMMIVGGPADFRSHEPRRQDADDREGLALQRDRLADRVGRAAEALLPEVVADHRHGPVRAATACVVRLRERAADERLDAEDVEEPAACVGAVRELALAAHRQVEARAAPGERAVEQLVLPIADLLPDRIRPRAAVDLDEALGLVHGQRLVDEAVEDREERGIGAHAERERQHRDDGDDGRGPQRAPGIANVGAQRRHEHSFAADARLRRPRGHEMFDDRVPDGVGDGRPPEPCAGPPARLTRQGVVVRERVLHARLEAVAELTRVRTQQPPERALAGPQRGHRLAHSDPLRETGRSAPTEAARSASRCFSASRNF